MLRGGIEISKELRPVWIETWEWSNEEKAYVRREDRKGLFHQWVMIRKQVKNGHFEDVPYGLIEEESGAMVEIHYDAFKFIDTSSKMFEMGFGINTCSPVTGDWKKILKEKRNQKQCEECEFGGEKDG